MSIKYKLQENKLTTETDLYAAHVQQTGTVGLDDIVQRMLAQGSTVTRTDIVAVLEEAIKATELCLLDGFRVSFGGLFDLFPRIKGKFDGITDSFDSARHLVDVAARPGIRIRKAIRNNAVVTRVEAVKPAPSPLAYSDLGSGQVNQTVTSNAIGTINGHRLKYDQSQADEGIFFCDDVNPEVRITAVQNNTPSQLVFQVPDLSAFSDCYLEVRVRFGTELRAGRLNASLIVFG